MAEVNKNPFEIRLETLKMAKEMLDKLINPITLNSTIKDVI